MSATASAVAPVVLLLHAFPCDHTMWSAQADQLTDAGYRVLAPDLPGFGGAALPAVAPDLDVVAGQLIEWLDEQQVTQCAVAGLSLGGYTAMALLRQAPERITALMLVNTKATADPPPALANRLAVAERAEADGNTEFLVEAMIPGLLGETTRSERPEVVDRTAAWIRAAAPATVAWYQRAMAQRPDSLASLSQFNRPAAVIYGEEDTVLSPLGEQEAMVAVLPNSVLIRIPSAGHLSAVERPTAVSEALLQFLAAQDQSKR